MPMSDDLIVGRRRGVPTPEDFERCRTLRHAWDVVGRAVVKDSYTGIEEELHLRCIFCTSTRIDMLDRRGDLVARTYEYPHGYEREYLPEDIDLSLQTLRLRLLTRTADKTTELTKEAS